MHRPTNWDDRIIVEDGQVYRILKAIWHDYRHNLTYEVDVYKENDAGEAWAQNLYNSVWSGYAVAFPGLPFNDNHRSYYGYDDRIVEEEGWEVWSRRSQVGISRMPTDQEKELVCEYYPDFKYLLKKYQVTSRRDLMDKLILWLEHHELEIVLASGFEQVAMNRNFWRITEKNRKETCLFMRQNPQFDNLTLQEIRQAMKADSPADYAEYLSSVPSWHRRGSNSVSGICITYQDYKYLVKAAKKMNTHGTETMNATALLSEYTDYRYMLERSDHPLTDYWKYPSDISAFHDRLVEEERVREEARRIAREKAEEERNRIKKLVFEEIIKKYKGIEKVIDGYRIFVTADFEEWKHQAAELHQCIVAAGYYQKMADQKSTIVFIQKDGVPEATAEVSNEGKILQFYANELDRHNCKPSKHIQAIFNEWLSEVPLKKFKPILKRKKQKEVA